MIEVRGASRKAGLKERPTASRKKERGLATP